jgi:hypothetical protein
MSDNCMSDNISDEDKIKFERCQEHRQIGYLCDFYPTCRGCKYQIEDSVYIALGGKLIG